MSVDHEIYMIFLEYIEAGLGLDRLRSPEQDIGDVRSHHGSAPAVGERGAHGPKHDIVGVLVNAHCRAVQHLYALAVDCPGSDTQLLPDLLPLFGRAGQVGKFSALLPELIEELERDLLGNLVHGLALDVNAEVARDAVQLAHVLDLEILGLAARDREQGVGQVSRMVRMRRRSGSHHTGEIPRRYDGQSSTADAFGLFFLAHEPAGAHVAHLAAGTLMPDRAGLQFVCAVERRLEVLLAGGLQQDLRGRVNRSHVLFHNRFLNSFRNGDNAPWFYTGSSIRKIEKKCYGKLQMEIL